jgi:hypothetical protein
MRLLVALVVVVVVVKTIIDVLEKSDAHQHIKKPE